MANLIQMIDAFGQKRLHLDEDLQIQRFTTVHLSGCPQSLYENKKKKEHHKSASAGKEAPHRINKGDITSKLDQFISNCSHERNKDIVSKKSEENPSSAPEQSTDSEAFSEEAFRRRRPIKPPNVLVYCGQDEKLAKSTYTSVKSSLDLCLNTDVYIIYHLTHAEMLASPWTENTALLIITSGAMLSPEVEQKLNNYINNNKGKLLSFGSSIEKAYVSTTPVPKEEATLHTFKLDDSQSVSCLRGDVCYLQGNIETSVIIIPYDKEIVQHNAVEEIEQTCKRALVLKTSVEGGGVVLMSQLLLEKDPASSTQDESTFTALKQSNTGRLMGLKHLLASLEMDVSPRASPALTPCCLLTQKQELRKKFLNGVHRKLNNESILPSKLISLAFLESAEAYSSLISPTLLPVITGSTTLNERWGSGFDEPDYWRHLGSSRLGQVVLYTDVISSTMPVFDGLLFSLPLGSVGPVAIAGRQTSGRGRGGNMWLSPLGCAMFTFPLAFDVYSQMGQKISFLQHVISTAVVHGIRTLPGYEHLDLRLKWPNDIYYGAGMKLGGVIVTSTMMGTTLYATIGCGVNVANSDPTICINDVIQLHNRSLDETSSKSPLNPLTPAGVIARTLTTLEKLIEEFDKSGHEQFCQVYYKYWLHGGVNVTLALETEDGNGQGEIIGLDEFGFLSVRKQSGETISVQPDGNSFDMMQNLVYCKRRL